ACVSGVVYRVVVLHTEWADGSIAVAEQHGALFTCEPWHDDLAAPRNRALDLAAGTWILSLDADERVRGDQAAGRARLRDDDGSVGFRVRCAPRVGWTPVREHRLWRNRADIRFAGAVHQPAGAATP